MSKQFETTHWDADKVRSQGEKSAQNHRRRKNKKFNWGIYIACVVLGSVVLASLGWLLANDLCSLNKKDVTVTIEVTEGETLGQVARQLKQEGLINYKWFFKLYANITGDKKLIDPGSYELTSDMDYRALIRGMHDYEAAKLKQEGKVKVTIPEGYTVQETIELLASKGVGTVEELTDACANYPFEDYTFLDSSKLGDISRMEGFLYPDTHEFYTGKAVLAIDTLLYAFQMQIS